MEYTDKYYISSLLYKRKPDAHKGDFGKVLICAGSPGMAGAAILCGRAALKSGAGLVQFLLPDLNSPLLPILQISVPEATCVPERSLFVSEKDHPSSSEADAAPGLDFSGYTAISCGSGLGKSRGACRILCQLLNSYAGPLILDADALNLISESPELKEALLRSAAQIIITPHIGEARRLLHTDDRISTQDSRVEAACKLAQSYRCIAVLKGAGTLTARQEPASPGESAPAFRVFQNTTGNPGMATAGSGDCLAGLITSLAAQGYSPMDAARIGVYIHGMAGDMAAQELSEMGVTASDIVHYIPQALKHSLRTDIP